MATVASALKETWGHKAHATTVAPNQTGAIDFFIYPPLSNLNQLELAWFSAVTGKMLSISLLQMCFSLDAGLKTCFRAWQHISQPCFNLHF